MSDPKALVERFYHIVWNRADEDAARALLAPDFRFRGSLGAEKTGPEGFIDYMSAVHQALSEYTCTILTLVAEGTSAAARMRFEGNHAGPFMGVEATGNPIAWEGAAFFETENGRITSLWVLGDIDAIRRQLNAGPDAAFGDS